MNEWAGWQTEGQTDLHKERSKSEETDRQTKRRIDGKRQMENRGRQTDIRRIKRKTDIDMARLTGGQTDKEMYRRTYIFV